MTDLKKKIEAREWYIALDSCNAINCYYGGSKYNAYTNRDDAMGYSKITTVIESAPVLARIAELESQVSVLTEALEECGEYIELKNERDQSMGPSNGSHAKHDKEDVGFGILLRARSALKKVRGE